MQKFFVAHEGIQKGPWTFEEISQKLVQKDLEWNDYIYDEKNQDWVMLLEFPAFTLLFNKSFKNPIPTKSIVSQIDPLRERAWYILKQDNNYGPFSKFEMIQMLQSKTLFEYDFIWKQGLESWKRLADVKDFNPENIRNDYKNWNDSDSKDDEVFFRRRHLRAKYECHVLVHDRKKLFKAESLEISAGGAGLKIKGVNFDIEQQLYLHFRASDQVPAFNAVCRVVSKTGQKFGIRFLHVASVAKDAISTFTNRVA